MNPHSIFQLAESMHKTCYLPRLSGETLEFVRHRTNEPVAENRYGIPEPVESSENEGIKPEKLDLVFLPLVAFTRQGQRLGMGLDTTIKLLLSYKRIPKQDLSCWLSLRLPRSLRTS